MNVFCSAGVRPSGSALEFSNSSAAPLIEVSGDFSSWVRWAEKVAI